MIRWVLNKRINIFLILVHCVIGFLGSGNKLFTGLIYLAICTLFIIDIIQTKDKYSRAGFYALYIMGFEIVYRISGVSISYEMGKYLCIIVLLTGMIVNSRKDFPYIFILGLFLLLPSIIVTEDPDQSRIRKEIMFNISGPLSLIFSGMYFYKRKVNANVFYTGLRIAALPAISLITILTFKSNVSDMVFDSIGSSSGNSGGFGANQVSSSLGWFILLSALLLINKRTVYGSKVVDLGVLCMLMLRALLTFSRGGVMAAVIALAMGMFYVYINNTGFRRYIGRSIGYLFIGLIFLSGVVYYANSLTNNFLLYRYQGKTTKEVRLNYVDEDKDVLTGRSSLLDADLEAFLENPLFGTGYGGSFEYHMRYGQAVTAHTEFTRLMAENGIFGILYMIIMFVVLPLSFLAKKKGASNTMFFVSFILISFLTMFHGAMRLAIAGVVYGISQCVIVAPPKRKIN